MNSAIQFETAFSSTHDEDKDIIDDSVLLDVFECILQSAVLTPKLITSLYNYLFKYRSLDALEESFPLILSASKKTPGSTMITSSLSEFKENFDIFTEEQLADINWNNIIVAGGSVLACLLKRPNNVGQSRSALHNYYHSTTGEFFNSDIDIFLYGLNRQQADAKVSYGRFYWRL
jgi:hypothetical protein